MDDAEPDELNELDLDIVNLADDEPDGTDRLAGFNDELPIRQNRTQIALTTLLGHRRASLGISVVRAMLSIYLCD